MRGYDRNNQVRTGEREFSRFGNQTARHHIRAHHAKSAGHGEEGRVRGGSYRWDGVDWGNIQPPKNRLAKVKVNPHWKLESIHEHRRRGGKHVTPLPIVPKTPRKKGAGKKIMHIHGRAAGTPKKFRPQLGVLWCSQRLTPLDQSGLSSRLDQTRWRGLANATELSWIQPSWAEPRGWRRDSGRGSGGAKKNTKPHVWNQRSAGNQSAHTWHTDEKKKFPDSAHVSSVPALLSRWVPPSASARTQHLENVQWGPGFMNTSYPPRERWIFISHHAFMSLTGFGIFFFSFFFFTTTRLGWKRGVYIRRRIPFRGSFNPPSHVVEEKWSAPLSGSEYFGTHQGMTAKNMRHKMFPG